MSTPREFVYIPEDVCRTSLWEFPPSAICVWIALLFLRDKDGYVDAPLPGIAYYAHLSVEETREALVMLASPDPKNKIQDNGGRRIKRNAGGIWLLDCEGFADLPDEMRESCEGGK